MFLSFMLSFRSQILNLQVNTVWKLQTFSATNILGELYFDLNAVFTTLAAFNFLAHLLYLLELKSIFMGNRKIYKFPHCAKIPTRKSLLLTHCWYVTH